MENHFTMACVSISIRNWEMVACPFPVTELPGGVTPPCPLAEPPSMPTGGAHLPAHFVLFPSQHEVLTGLF